MKLAVQENLFPVKNLGEFLKIVQKWKLDAVEVWGGGLGDRIDEVKRSLKDSGITTCSICPGADGIRGSLLNDEEWETAAADLGEFLRLGAALDGAAIILVPRFRNARFLRLYPDMDVFIKNKEKFLDRLAPLAKEAENLGVTILLEPLNRYEADFLLTLDRAAQLCAGLNSPHVRILADLFHMNIEETDIPSTLARNSRWLGHIHLADSNRLLPGQGNLNFSLILKTLEENSFAGAMCIECHCPVTDPLEAIARSVAHLRRCMT
ncbi:MAG: sugar phosphate isomerase/epimerase family protein [bacterium]